MTDREALLAMLERIGVKYIELGGSPSAEDAVKYYEVPMPDAAPWWNFDKDGNLVSIV